MWVFGFVADDFSGLPRYLRAAFRHPWISTFQIGFGPPLYRSSPKLAERAREAKGVLEKLDAYLELCVLDERECERLGHRLRQQVLNRRKLITTARLDEANNMAFDLSLSLVVPERATESQRALLEGAGVDLDQVPATAAPDALAGRFCLRLGDPRNQRLLEHASVTALDRAAPPELALELWVPIAFKDYWWKYATDLADREGLVAVDLGSKSEIQTAWTTD